MYYFCLILFRNSIIIKQNMYLPGNYVIYVAYILQP